MRRAAAMRYASHAAPRQRRAPLRARYARFAAACAAALSLIIYAQTAYMPPSDACAARVDIAAAAHAQQMRMLIYGSAPQRRAQKCASASAAAARRFTPPLRFYARYTHVTFLFTIDY